MPAGRTGACPGCGSRSFGRNVLKLKGDDLHGLCEVANGIEVVIGRHDFQI